MWNSQCRITWLWKVILLISWSSFFLGALLLFCILLCYTTHRWSKKKSEGGYFDSMTSTLQMSLWSPRIILLANTLTMTFNSLVSHSHSWLGKSEPHLDTSSINFRWVYILILFVYQDLKDAKRSFNFYLMRYDIKLLFKTIIFKFFRSFFSSVVAAFASLILSLLNCYCWTSIGQLLPYNIIQFAWSPLGHATFTYCSY